MRLQSEDPVRLAGDREPVTGLAIAARDARLRTLAAQRPGDGRTRRRGALRPRPKAVSPAQTNSACAPRTERDPLPVVQLAVRGTGGWRPVAVNDVAAGPVTARSCSDIAGRRDESGELGHRFVGGRGFVAGELVGLRRARRGRSRGPSGRSPAERLARRCLSHRHRSPQPKAALAAWQAHATSDFAGRP